MSIRQILATLVLSSCISPAFAMTLSDSELSKELQQIIGNEQKVSAVVQGNSAVITVRSTGKWEYGDESCKLTSVTLAQKAMFLNSGVTNIRTRFYGNTGQSYRETVIDSNQVASLGALLNSVDINWHGTTPNSSTKLESDRFITAGRLRIILPANWKPIAHPDQDTGDKFSTVVARLYSTQPNVSAEIIVRVHTQVSSAKRQFDYTTEFLKKQHFTILSSGSQPLSKLGDCWQAQAETLTVKGRPEWQQHKFFEVGGHIYSAALYCPRAFGKSMGPTFDRILDAIQVIPDTHVQ